MTGNRKTDSQNIDPAHKLILDAIEHMMDRNPDADSPLGRLLDGVSKATEQYEKELFGPFPDHKAHGSGQASASHAPDAIRRSIEGGHGS